MTELYCAACHKHLATLRDAKVRQGVVVYCRECALHNKPKPEPVEMPEFFKGIFGGR